MESVLTEFLIVVVPLVRSYNLVVHVRGLDYVV